MSLISKMNYA